MFLIIILNLLRDLLADQKMDFILAFFGGLLIDEFFFLPWGTSAFWLLIFFFLRQRYENKLRSEAWQVKTAFFTAVFASYQLAVGKFNLSTCCWGAILYGFWSFFRQEFNSKT